MRIAVAGGQGVVGRHAVLAAQEAGHDVVSLSRRSGVDARTGAGLAEALRGVDVIIDTTDPNTTNRAKATAFFTEVARQWHDVGSAQGVSRLVTLSIVGLERVAGFGYYEAKLAQEAAVQDGPLPVSIVRATQFHEFPAQVLAQMGKGPLAAVPIMRMQPVAARLVGQVLVQVAADPPTEVTTEIAGPQPEDLVTLARAVAQKRGSRVTVVPLRVPGRAGKAMRSGGQLPGPEVPLAGPTFAEWLEGDDLSLLTP
jgi:uncharacterized protein YbjT (DUF2867 family)